MALCMHTASLKFQPYLIDLEHDKLDLVRFATTYLKIRHLLATAC